MRYNNKSGIDEGSFSIHKYHLKYVLLIFFVASTIPAAQSITFNIKDSTTGNFLNSTANITYNQYPSYQETATSTLSTVQKNTGNYEINNLTNTSFYLYINYTKPDSAIGALWEVNRGSMPAFSTIRNYSLAACYNASSTQIQLRAAAYYSGNQTEECYNGTTWVVLNTAAKNGSAFPANRPSNNELQTYDADNTTGSCFTNFFVAIVYGGWGWTNTFSNGAGGNNCILNEEKIHWNITSAAVTETAPSGTLNPARQSNYTTINSTFNAPGYASTTINNINLALGTYTINLTTSNNVTFLFVNEETGLLLNGTGVTASLTSNSYGTNFTTNNGSRTLQNLSYGQYQITYNATGFTQRNYNILLPSSTGTNTVLYLLPTSSSTTVLFTVTSSANFRLQNATVFINKKNTSGTGYYTVATCTTDSNGQCPSNINLFLTTYRFQVYYNGAFRGDSLDTIPVSTTIPLVVEIEEDPLINIFQLNQISTSLNYNTASGIATWIVSDIYGNTQSGCVRIYRRTGLIRQQINGSCGSGSSFTVTAYANSSLGDEVYSVGTIYYAGQERLVATSNSKNNSDTPTGGNTGLVLLAIVFAVGITLAIKYSWDMTTALVMFGVSTVLFWSIGLVGWAQGTIVAIIITLLIVITRANK